MGPRVRGRKTLQHPSQSGGPFGLKKQIAETQRRRGQPCQLFDAVLTIVLISLQLRPFCGQSSSAVAAVPLRLKRSAERNETGHDLHPPVEPIAGSESKVTSTAHFRRGSKVNSAVTISVVSFGTSSSSAILIVIKR